MRRNDFRLRRANSPRTVPGVTVFKATTLPFKFIHTADLHLDSPLKALALRDPDLAATVGTATRTALSRIVDLCIDEQVDALLIAGDLWDGKYGFVAKILDLPISVLLVYVVCPPRAAKARAG